MSTSFVDRESEIPLPRLRSISQLWTLAAILGGLGVAALVIDVPLAAWVQSGKCPNVVQQLCNLSEVFGHGLGIILIVLAIAVLDPWHRYVIPRILAAALGSGLVANVFKLVVARARPFHFDLNRDSLESFIEWFPLLTNSSWEQGFPSSHAATAAGLAIVLAYFYPRGRWLFPVFAGMAGCQRTLDLRHFMSDVFWGASVGCIFAPLCVYGSAISRGFDRLEERLLARRALKMTGRSSHRRPNLATTSASGPDRTHAA